MAGPWDDYQPITAPGVPWLDFRDLGIEPEKKGVSGTAPVAPPKAPPIPGEGALAKAPVGAGTDVAQKALEGIPILGAYVPQAGAAVSAAANPLTGAGEKGESFGERYTKNLAVEQARSKAMAKEHPYISTGAELLGGAAALGPLGATSVGAKVLGLTGKSLPGMIGRGALSGAGISAADAVVRGQDPQTAAMVGGVVGGAVPVVARGIGAGVSALRGAGSAVAMPTEAELKAAAKAAYQSPEVLALEIHPHSTEAAANQIKTGLLKDSFRDYLAPKTFRAVEELKTPAGPTAKVADIEGVRRLLGEIAATPDPTERAAASRAIEGINDYLANIKPRDVIAGDAKKVAGLLDEARGNWAAMSRMAKIANSMDKAERQAGSAGAGANIDNAMRQQIKAILNSPKKLRGFSPDEITQMEQIVRGTPTGNVARLLGKLAPTGIVSGSLSAGAGMLAGGPAGAIGLPVIGSIAKKAADRSTKTQVEKLTEMLSARAPHAQQAALVNQLANAKSAAQRAQLERIIAATERGMAMPLLTGNQ